jgi:hypothetical protein
MLKKATAICFSLLCLALPALAQTPGAGPSERWAFFGAPGVTTGRGDTSGAALHVGGGAEIVWVNGLGLAVDVGYLWPPEAIEVGVGIFSGGLIYEFRTSRRYSPYVRGGYTLFFGEGAASLMHSGIGFSRWFNEQWGMNFELRDHLFIAAPERNLIEFSIGLVIKSR